MIALLLCGLIAGAWAAPQFDFDRWSSRSPYYPSLRFSSNPYLNGNTDVFNTQKFWSDLSKDLMEIDTMLTDFSRRFPSSVSQEGIEGTNYIVTIPLSGFEEKDIVVKAREGLLMIQANQKYSGGSARNYLDMRTLPTNVNVTGTWIFEAGVLKITFPLKDGVKVPETATEDVTTRQPDFTGSREEIETNVSGNDNNQDVDIDIGRGDMDKVTSNIETNEINGRSAVEATTYAVDLKDEVEFVPVRY